MRIRSARDLGAVARQQRRDMGLSQQELAQRAGVTRQWLVRFEQGNTDVALSKALTVLRALDLDIDLRARPVGTTERTEAAAGSPPPRYFADSSLVALHATETIRGRSLDESLAELRTKIARMPTVTSDRSTADG